MVDSVRKRVVVSGRVQGVWFRQSTQNEAKALGLSGWVRNRPDGTVEAAFEGPATLVNEAVEWARHGPDRAHVDHIEVFEEPVANRPGFDITG